MEEPRTFLLGGAVLALLVLASSGLLLGPALVGISRAVLRRQRGETVAAADLFHGFGNFGHTFLAGFAFSLAVAAGLLFLIVPGLVLGALLFPMFPALAGSAASFPEALDQARRLTQPILVEQTVVFTLALVLAASGLLLFVVGVTLTLPLAVVALVLAYQAASDAARGDAATPGCGT